MIAYDNSCNKEIDKIVDYRCKFVGADIIRPLLVILRFGAKMRQYLIAKCGIIKIKIELLDRELELLKWE